MMKPKIENLTIENFRTFRQISINGMGRVNLITGQNNTGKSTVLEALRLMASAGALSVIFEILDSREESTPEKGETDAPDLEGVFQLSSLFRGFPIISEEIEPIIINSNGGQIQSKLSMWMNWYSEERTADGTIRLATRQKNLYGEDDALPGLVIEADGNKRIITFRQLQRTFLPSRLINPERILPFMYVNPYAGEKTSTLGSLWDKVALTEYEKYVIEALRIIDPNISGVTMVNEEVRFRSRKAIVNIAGSPRVSLRSFGDGLNRLFSIALSLVNAKDGLLLIDEFENGMHYSVQLNAWRAIFKLARILDIQVVATTHSWDTIETFQKAASEDPEEGVLIKLTRNREDVIPTIFTENELVIATRDRIEVR
jgi:predicted ATPase